MKKLKWILLIFVIIMIFIIAISSCKKTKALESVFKDNYYDISAREQDNYNFVCIYNIGAYNNLVDSYDLLNIKDSSGILRYYLNVTNSNDVRIVNLPNYGIESHQTTSRVIQCEIVEDLSYLYLIIYEINFTFQRTQGTEPVADGITRTMLTRYNLSSIFDLETEWEINFIRLVPLPEQTNWTGNCLVNCSYISYSDTPQDINNWVDKQVYNSLMANYLIDIGYDYGNIDGYDDGYDDGLDEGVDIGYSNGYDEGYDVGHADGMQEGLNQGYDEGYGAGYDDGYDDGEAGETAVSRTVTLLGSIFGAVGSVMSIELFPNVPLGLFFLVPLFFAAIGLILWIWRRN